MWLWPDGIVQLMWAPRAAMGFDGALAATDAMARLDGDFERLMREDGFRESRTLVDAKPCKDAPLAPGAPARTVDMAPILTTLTTPLGGSNE